MAISLVNLAGNKFVNGCIFGAADILGGIFSGYLQKFISDTRLLQYSCVVILTSSLTLYYLQSR